MIEGWLAHWRNRARRWSEAGRPGAGRLGTGRPEPGNSAGVRWVVIDVETSGLDPARDRVLAIGAVAVHAGPAPGSPARIVLADSLELRLAQQAPSSRANILVHGIGEQAQRDGLEPAQAAQQLLAFVAGAPLVAFHAAFDRAFLTRELKRCGSASLPRAWVDVAQLAPVVHPEVRARALDDWLGHFELLTEARHDACADALVTAMLFVRLLAQLPDGERDPASVMRVCSGARWLPRA